MRDARTRTLSKLGYSMLILFIVAVFCGILYRLIDFNFQRVPENFNWLQSNIDKFVNETSRQPYEIGSGMDILRQILGFVEWSFVAIAFLLGFIVHPVLESKYRRGGLSSNASIGIAVSCVIVLSFVGINLMLIR